MIAADVVHETIDGEAILINLATGTYFSLDGSGAEAWALLAAGWSLPEAAAHLATSHGADTGAVHAELVRLAAELHGHGLVVAPPDAAGATAGGSLGTFAPPVLGVFTDMEEFLLVDPIHEVEPARGWPHVAPAAE